MRFSVGRAEVRVDFGVLLLFAWCVIAGEFPLLLLSAISLLVHECAHAIAAKNLGLAISRVSVWPFGAVLTLDASFGCAGEGIVAAAGPLASLAVSGMLKLSESLIGVREWSSSMIRINLLVAVLNLLPAFPLDGGRIFRAVLKRTAEERTARRVLLAFTTVIAAASAGAGVFLILRGAPFWTLLFLPPFLIVSAFREWRLPDAGVVARVMERKSAMKKGEPQPMRFVAISEEACMEDAVNAVSSRHYTVLRVRSGGRWVELDEDAVLRAAAKFGMRTTLKTAISGLTLPKSRVII